MVNITNNEQLADIAAMRVGLGNETNLNEAKRGYNMSTEQEALFGKIADLVQQGRSQEALSLAATPFEHNDYEEKAKNKVLTGRDATSGERQDAAKVNNPKAKNTPESDRLKTVVDRTRLYLQFSRGGLGSLTTQDQTTLVNEAVKYIAGDQHLLRLYADASGAAVDTTKVRQFVDSRAFKNILIAKLNAVYNDTSSDKIKQLEEAHADAWEEFQKKEAEKVRKTQERDAVKHERELAEQAKTTFETPTGNTGKSALDELNALAGNPDIQNAIEAKNQVDEAYDRIRNENNPGLRKFYYQEYNDALGRLSKARTAIQSDATKLASLTRYEILKDQKNNIDRRLAETSQAKVTIDRLDQEIKAIEIESRKLKIAEADARHERERLSVAAPDDVEGLIYDATQEYVDKIGATERDRARRLLEGEQTAAKEKKDKAGLSETDKAKEKVDTLIANRYISQQRVERRVGMFKKESYLAPKADKAVIDADRLVIFNPSLGPDSIIDNMLLSTVCRSGYAGTRCQNSDEQSRLDTLRADKTYRDGMRDKLMVNMLINMKDAGENPKPEEIKFLINSEKLAPIVEKYLTRSTEVQGLVTKYQEAGLLPKDMEKSAWAKEMVKRFGYNGFFNILLVGIAALGGFPAVGGIIGSLFR